MPDKSRIVYHHSVAQIVFNDSSVASDDVSKPAAHLGRHCHSPLLIVEPTLLLLRTVDKGTLRYIKHGEHAALFSKQHSPVGKRIARRHMVVA